MLPADNGLAELSQESPSKRLFKLASWARRDKVLLWFAKGLDTDAGARLTFSPDLNKHMREELHRLRETRFPNLTSKGVGFGNARSIVFAHGDADLGAEDAQLSEEQLAAAAELFRDMRSAGHTMSLDEVKTRLAMGETTGAHLPYSQSCTALRAGVNAHAHTWHVRALSCIRAIERAAVCFCTVR